MSGADLTAWLRALAVDHGAIRMRPHETEAALLQAADEIERQAEDAARYRWLASSCRSTSEHWGGRWSIVVEGPAPERHDEEDAFDAAIDAAMAKEVKA